MTERTSPTDNPGRDLTFANIMQIEPALDKLQKVGAWPQGVEQTPVRGLLDRIKHLDEDRVARIGRVLGLASSFNEVVRNEISSMRVGERYEAITSGFDSIREDTRSMVGQIEKGGPSAGERIGNVWMKLTRGDIATRFDRIKDVYVEVAHDTHDQIERERAILEAYMDFRQALKSAEVLAHEVHEKGMAVLGEVKGRLDAAAMQVTDATDAVPAQKARLELERDEVVREFQQKEQEEQIAKDVAENLTIAYSTSEVIMMRLLETTKIKERVHQQSVAFFSTNETVFTALSASFTGILGVNEATRTLESMTEGVSRSIETIAELGGEAQERALKAGYGPTIRVDAVRKLVDNIVAFQTNAHGIVEQMRDEATRNAREISTAVEDGKSRVAALSTGTDRKDR